MYKYLQSATGVEQIWHRPAVPAGNSRCCCLTLFCLSLKWRRRWRKLLSPLITHDNKRICSRKTTGFVIAHVVRVRVECERESERETELLFQFSAITTAWYLSISLSRKRWFKWVIMNAPTYLFVLRLVQCNRSLYFKFVQRNLRSRDDFLSFS